MKIILKASNDQHDKYHWNQHSSVGTHFVIPNSRESKYHFEMAKSLKGYRLKFSNERTKLLAESVLEHIEIQQNPPCVRKYSFIKGCLTYT